MASAATPTAPATTPAAARKTSRLARPNREGRNSSSRATPAAMARTGSLRNDLEFAFASLTPVLAPQHQQHLGRPWTEAAPRDRRRRPFQCRPRPAQQSVSVPYGLLHRRLIDAKVSYRQTPGVRITKQRARRDRPTKECRKGPSVVMAGVAFPEEHAVRDDMGSIWSQLGDEALE